MRHINDQIKYKKVLNFFFFKQYLKVATIHPYHGLFADLLSVCSLRKAFASQMCV